MFYGMKDEITEWAQKNWKIILGVAIAFFFLAFFRNLFFLGAILGLTVITSVIASRTKTKLFGVELVTFSTVLVGYVYGPFWGCIAGIGLEGVNAFIVARWMRVYNFWVIPSFGVAGIAAGFGFGLGFSTLGIAIAVGLHVIYSFASLVLTGRLHPKYLMYAVPNIAVNVFMFTGFGARALGFLS